MFGRATITLGIGPHSSYGDHYIFALLFLSSIFLGHRLGDDLVDWNSGVSVRTYVRPYVHKKFVRFPSNFVCG